MPPDQTSSGRNLPIGLMVVGSEMASFTLFGLLLDYAFGTMPGFTIGLTLLGLGAAFFHLVRISRALSGAGPRSPSPPEPPHGSAP